MSEKTNRLAIYLIKPDVTQFDEIVEPDAKPFDFDGPGKLYIEPSTPHPPDWVNNFFGAKLAVDPKLLVASAKAVLLIPIQHDGTQRIFAIAFGQGRHFLRENVVEERFGLKVVLNTVKEDSLRSIDKTALASGVPKQSREQISREGGASSFGIDFEQDLVNAVTGTSSDQRFGKIVSGRDSLHVSAKFDIDDVDELLSLAMKQYESTDYLKSFDWIDQIQHIKDASTTQLLEAERVRTPPGRGSPRPWRS